MITIKNDWSLLLLGFGALQGYFFAGLLAFQKQGNIRANRWLALLVFLVAYFLTAEVIMLSGLHRYFPHVIGTGFVFWYMLGGLVYIYTRLLGNHQFRFSWWDALHLLPFIYIMQQMSRFYLLPAARKITLFEMSVNNSPSYQWSYLFLSILLLGYFFISVRGITRSITLKKEASRIFEIAHLSWVRTLLIAFSAYLVFDSVMGYVLLSQGNDAESLSRLTMMVMTLFVLIVAYTAVRDPQKLFPEERTPVMSTRPLEAQVLNIIPFKKKYQNSALSPADAQKHLARLLRLMDKEKPYLNSELKLPALAEMLDLSTYHLSQVLNQEMQQSFYEFVNVYRIKEVQQRMLNPAYKDYTILGIALDAGFNSKTSFNRMFKKCTGLTPSSYLKKHAELTQRAG